MGGPGPGRARSSVVISGPDDMWRGSLSIPWAIGTAKREAGQHDPGGEHPACGPGGSACGGRVQQTLALARRGPKTPELRSSEISRNAFGHVRHTVHNGHSMGFPQIGDATLLRRRSAQRPRELVIKGRGNGTNPRHLQRDFHMRYLEFPPTLHVVASSSPQSGKNLAPRVYHQFSRVPESENRRPA